MSKIHEYIKLIRVHQWYKNLVVFFPIFFAGKIFDLVSLELIAIGFLALCLISSTNYILNDIIDLKNDKLHPEKKFRPLASGKINVIKASIIGIIFFIVSLLIAYNLNLTFFILVLFLFVSTTLYSLWLKNEPILDVLVISTNFVVRAISGAYIISVFVSPWLIVCPFFIALFLAVSKRKGDLSVLKNTTLKHKPVLKYYTTDIINGLSITSITCFIIAYSLYAFSRTEALLVTLPFAIYTIYRYYLLSITNSKMARTPEKEIFTDKKIIIAIALWGIITFVIFYYI